MVLFGILQGLRDLLNRLSNDHDLREEAIGTRVCGVLDQVSNASSNCSRPKKGDEVITESHRRSIGKVIGGAIW